MSQVQSSVDVLVDISVPDLIDVPATYVCRIWLEWVAIHCGCLEIRARGTRDGGQFVSHTHFESGNSQSGQDYWYMIQDCNILYLAYAALNINSHVIFSPKMLPCVETDFFS